MTPRRTLRAAAYAFVFAGVGGCQTPLKRLPPAPIPLGTSIQLLNANTERIDATLRASGPVDGEAATEKGRHVSFHADGVLFFRAPRHLRFDLKKFGERQFLFGSNDDEYWLYSKEDGEYFCGRHDSPGDLPPEFPLRPDQIADALALNPIDISGVAPVAQRVVDDYQQLLFLHVDDSGNTVIEKEYWIDRYPPRVVRHVIFRDADGVVEMESQLDDYRMQDDGELYLPHRVEAVWPRAAMSLVFHVSQWRLVAQVEPDGPQFATPRECRSLDVDRP